MKGPGLAWHGERLTDVVHAIGWLALAWWAGCETGVSAGHHQGVCDQVCHAHATVNERCPLKCLCPGGRVVVVKAGKP
jgi:hypothetical protein